MNIYKFKIYKKQQTILEIYIGINDMNIFENIKKMFNTFLQKLSYKRINYKQYKTIIFLNNYNKDIYKYVNTYWQGINYNITLPNIDENNISNELLYNKNLLDNIDKFYIRYYNGNITNTIKLYINIFNVNYKKNDEIYELLITEIKKLNKYISCENVNCNNNCDNNGIVIPYCGKLFYTNNETTLDKLSVINSTHNRNIDNIPLCLSCKDELLKQECYLCLEEFNIKSNIVYKCDNINHSIHSECDKQHENTIIKKSNIANFTNNLNGLISCGCCRGQNNKVFCKDKYKYKMNIIELTDSDYEDNIDYEDSNDIENLIIIIENIL